MQLRVFEPVKLSRHTAQPAGVLGGGPLGLGILHRTADPFKTSIPHKEGEGMDFLTRQSSKRAQTVLYPLAELD